jgi:hypothetical protein
MKSRKKWERKASGIRSAVAAFIPEETGPTKGVLGTISTTNTKSSVDGVTPVSSSSYPD